MGGTGVADGDGHPAEDGLAPPSSVVRAGPPFGPEFFRAVLPDRVATFCAGQPELTPVVELHLADGYAPNVCHVLSLGPDWLVANVFRDKETCEEMDLVFLPYALVTRVTVSLHHPAQRPAGFQLSPAQ